MKIKWGALVVDGRGKLGGHVASKNRSGAYLRTKVSPDNPQTKDQMLRRSELAQLSSGWSQLTEEQRAAWNAAVDNFKRDNVFGDNVKPTGKNLYTGLNLNLLQINKAIITTPPEPQEIQDIGEFTGQIDPQDGLEIATNASAIDDLKIYATGSLSKGTSFVKNRLRFIGVITAGDTGPFKIDQMYTERFGTATAGQKIGIKVVSVSAISGQAGPGNTWVGILQ